MKEAKKYYLKCIACGNEINGFEQWFQHKQKCCECGSNRADVWYKQDFKNLIKLIKSPDFKPDSLWGYFDFLPLNDKKHIVSVGGEGVVPINHWTFLEDYAKRKYNRDIKVYAQRHDDNFSTGTFKDLAGTVVASILKEHGIKQYVVASTGNIGVAYSRYTGAAGISLSAFLPDISLKMQEAEIGCFGQSVFRVKGDYARAKALAKEFSDKYNILLSAGNFDPMRLEAKKTMMYEWLRLMPEFPTVFMQAISGGSGPIGVDKACRELQDLNVFDTMPRFILPQPEKCAPMAHAYQKARQNNFPKGWENDYPVYENPKTQINTLSTGNPTAYPALSQIVRKSKGEITAVNEEKTVDVARIIAYEAGMRMGPAAAVTVVGFFEALRDDYIRNGDVVMLNIGEGVRRSPQFIENFDYTTKNVTTINDCFPVYRESYREKLWEKLERYD